MSKFGRLKRKLKGASSEELPEECTNVGRHHKMVLMLGSSEQGFHVVPYEPPPPEFEALVHLHSDRLRALLDRPVILAVHWDEGDAAAIVQGMPADGDPNRDPHKRFEELTLPFPTLNVLQ
jgi:hypothetical protein